MTTPIAIFFRKTVKHSLILCCYILFRIELNAQSNSNNLGINYSFEDYNCCPVDIASAARWCQPNFWYSASAVGAYPSYVNACANNTITGVPFNAGGGAKFSICKNR